MAYFNACSISASSAALNDGDNCPVKDVLNRVGDNLSMLTVIMLSDHGTLRFNELHGLIDGISQKMLIVTLKMLEADGLLIRKMYAQFPLRWSIIPEHRWVKLSNAADAPVRLGEYQYARD
jgi:DNA-binding HxlR family transcriptional regulator